MICGECLQDTDDRWATPDCPDSMTGEHEPAECLDGRGTGEDCSGPVALWHSGGASGRSWPRCTRHGDERLARHDNSIEAYADSDVPPSWFDPAYAGERWDDDY